MNVHTTKNKNISRWSFCFFATLLLVSSTSFFLPSHVLAQTTPAATPVLQSNLTAANGWTSATCPASRYLSPVCFTNAQTKATALCQKDLTGLTGDTCTIVNSDNSQVITDVSASGKPSTVAVSANGNMTGDGSCQLLPMSSWGNCVTGALATVAAGMASLAGFLLGFVGAFFNWVVVITVFQFGAYFGNSAGLLAAWGILRDIGNIALLFGFILMGVLMILDLHSVDTRKAIPQLIIVAVLLNFSLFAAEAVIDVSNVLSAALYNQAGGAVACGVGQNTAKCASATNQGIAGQILNAAGLNDVFRVNGDTGNGGALLAMSSNDNVHKLIVYIGLTIFMSVTMVVLLAASIMLLIRGITLTIVMVLSPLGFAAMALPLPVFKSLSGQWQKALFSQAFFAPVYLLLVLVSLKIMDAVKTSLSPAGSTQGTLLQSLLQPNTSLSGIVLVFALVIGFMIAALMTAKGMGAIGADFATSVARKGVQSTMTAPLRLGAYGAGVGYRMGIAPRFDSAINKYNAKIGAARKQGGAVGALAKVFDNTAGGAITNTLAKGRDVKIGGAMSLEEKRKSDKARLTTTVRAADKAKAKSDILAGLGVKVDASGNPVNAADLDKLQAMEKSLQTIPVDDAISIFNDLKATDAQRVGQMLGTNKFKTIIENHDLDHTVQHELIHGRNAPIHDAVGDAARMEAVLKDKSAKEMELILLHDPELLTQIYDEVNPNTLGSVVDEGVSTKLLEGDAATPSQRALIRSRGIKYEKMNNELATLNDDGLKKLTTKMKNFGKAKADVIKAAADRVQLTKDHVASVIAEGKMTGADPDILLNKIIAFHRAHTGTAGYDDAEYARVKTLITTKRAGIDFFDMNRGAAAPIMP